MKPIDMLNLAVRMSTYAMPAANGNKNRCFVMTPESQILDILVCLESCPNVKAEKRLKRLRFLIQKFGNNIDYSVQIRAITLISKMVTVPLEVRKSLDLSNGPNIEKLAHEIANNKFAEDNGIVFDKPDKDAVFVPPINQAFHEHCKKIFNADGLAYDVLSKIALISLEVMLNSTRARSELAVILLSNVKLVFKGGASIGKFLFKSNKPLWDTLDIYEQEDIIRDYIVGGDNDTSLVFERTDAQNYSVEEVNSEIDNILKEFEVITLRHIKDYKVETILAEQTQMVVGSKFNYDGHEFTLSMRSSNGFEIVAKNETQNQLIAMTPMQNGHIFGSISHLVEFKTTKFRLARVKAAFTATTQYNGETMSVNCYAECLDVSALCVESEVLYEASYDNVSVEDL